MRAIVPVIAAVLWCSACSTELGRPDGPPPTPSHTTFHVERGVRFTPPEWPQELRADLYLPDGSGAHPAVLLLFGGGWHHGERTQLAPIATTLAQRGYVAVAIDYRLAPIYHFPAQLQDVQLAVRWMRANAATYDIDPRRIGAWGYSAGAHLAALLGGIDTRDALGEPGSRIEAVVAGGTPTDLTKPTHHHQVIELIGGTEAQKPQLYREASPVDYVDRGDPPVFLYHGGSDELVPLDHATDYKKKLDAAGVPCELMILHGRGHVMTFLTDQPAVTAALHFLDRYLRDAPLTVATDHAGQAAAEPPP
ncbi:alpha/beta hydrolase [Solimonas marina]|uniref:Alpha/beta hydrolase n=1 Tax=Solimonas marina TaxID=2714601 RepID=A0A969WC18_9GAMM|nr:alpha/beta hydrolase [Solimonas marina]NKF24611.1 alpha/beta hydrolase [Solimonas marina]